MKSPVTINSGFLFVISLQERKWILCAGGGSLWQSPHKRKCEGQCEPLQMPPVLMGTGCHKGLGRDLWVFSQNAVTYRKKMFLLEVYRKMVNRASEFSSAMNKRAGGWVVLVRSHLVMWRGDCIVKPPRMVAPSFQSNTKRWDGSGT